MTPWTNRTSASLALAVSLLCHVVALVQFRLNYVVLDVPELWYRQFYILLGISAGLSLALFLLPRSGKALIPLLVRVVVLIVMGVPEGSYLGTELSLFSSLLVEIMVYLDSPYSLVLSGLAIAFALLTQRSVRIWDRTTTAPPAQDLLALSIVLCLVGTLCWFLKRYLDRSQHQRKEIDRLEEAILKLTSANVGFQQYADTIGQKSAQEERKRVTREIHDTIGYTLVNIMMMMREASLHDEDNAELKRLHKQAQEQAQTGLSETQRALRMLRQYDQPAPRGVAEIRKLVTAFESATGLKVRCEYGNFADTFDETLNSVVYRIIQEGMTNAFRHGKATQVDVFLWVDETNIIVTVRDNGQGAALEGFAEGIGLSGMRERVENVGGSFEAGNVVYGFQISARIPHNRSRG
jgi:signal transduction histidine kinase